jgi:hypothetical protein
MKYYPLIFLPPDFVLPSDFDMPPDLSGGI